MLEEQTFLIRELKNQLVTRSHVRSPEVEIWSSPEVEKGIYLVYGTNWDFPGRGSEFPRNGKSVFIW